MKRVIISSLVFFFVFGLKSQKLGNKEPGKELKIAFVSYKTGSADIFLMNADGTHVEQITNSPQDNSFPFQIDKRTIGFTRRDSTNKEQKFKIDIITKVEEPFIEESTVPNSKWEVASEDGKYVAFIRSTDYSDRELFVYDKEFQRELNVSNNSLDSYKALSVGYSWSKDGKYLVFMSGPDWYNQYVRLYDLSNDKVITITERGYMNSGIRWLNDNQTIIANLKIKDQTLYELYSVNILDGKLIQLTEGINLHPDVSPDGEWVVFESQRHENYGEAYIMRKDGSDQRRLTNNDDYSGRCIWFDIK